MAELLRWDRCDAHLPWVRISRHHLDRADGSTAHRHDFAEWCWVESGSVRHHGSAGDEVLERGDLRLIRPGDEHALGGTAGGGILVTVSVPGPLFSEFAHRYHDHAAWPWPKQGDGSLRLDDAQLSACDGLLAGISQRDQERCDAEWQMAGLLRILRGGMSAGTMPDWLSHAVSRLNQPSSLAAGLPELVRLCGRSAAHVSREVRRSYGCTATDLVHRLRCEHAARELRLGTRAIAAIAGLVGYQHLGHFYRRFQACFGCAPRAYRMAALGGEVVAIRPPH